MSSLEFVTIEDHWERAIGQGNECYENRDIALAITHYSKALFYSELMVRNAEDAHKLNKHVASPFFVSCVNLANSFWELGKLAEAGKYFFYNVWHLKTLSNNVDIGELMQFEAKKNWEKAVLVLTDFHKKINQPLSVDFLDDETYKKIGDTRNLLILNKAKLN